MLNRVTRGTTPTLVFTLPFAAAGLTSAYITFRQASAVALEKTLADCTASGNTLALPLTQTDTLALMSSAYADIQIRAVTAGGAAIASDVVTAAVGEILKDGVIS